MLANFTKMCYTYDELSRVLSRTVVDNSFTRNITKENFLRICNEKRNELIKAINDLGEDISKIFQYAFDSFVFDLGLGCGLGIEGEIESIATAGLVWREDFITIKREAGESVVFGRQYEKYSGVGAFGAFIGTGEKNFDEFGCSEDNSKEIIEPHNELVLGAGAKLYLLVGGTVSVGFDLEYFLNKLIFDN